MKLKLYRRPDRLIVEEVIGVIHSLQPEWFTEDVPEDTRRDLLFQDVICAEVDGRLRSFLVFTSWEGSISITLMGTHPDYRGMGLGTQLIHALFVHASELGFERVTLLTVPPDAKPQYEHTIKFYKQHGFSVAKRYSEIWGSGAIEMCKNL